MDAEALLIFGERPLKDVLKKPKEKKPPFVKSPYLTPIVNDPDIIPSNSALSRLPLRILTALLSFIPHHLPQFTQHIPLH